MAKVSDEEFEQIEKERRHDEIVKALQNIRPSDTKNLEILLQKNLTALASLLKQDTPVIDTTGLAKALERPEKKEIDISPLLKELIGSIKDLTKTQEKPSGYRVKRNASGFIDEIVLK